jgi:pyridoxamine 5'-phosphate oxidase
VDADPLALMLDWYAQAAAAGEPEPEAMTLATATPDGRPSARMVLFRGLSHGRLRFFTHHDSRKAHELDANPRAAVVFHWPRLGRQIRVEGSVERLDDAEADAYFAQRPRGHQLQALASPQSRVIVGLDEVRARHHQLAAEYAGKDVPRPGYWGGYALRPMTIELWTRGPERLHERRVFDREHAGWRESQLAP